MWIDPRPEPDDIGLAGKLAQIGKRQIYTRLADPELLVGVALEHVPTADSSVRGIKKIEACLHINDFVN